MSIQPGDTIGGYRVIDVLGQGGMGKVFRVRSLLTEREEAMKIISADAAADSVFAERFLREIRVHASLDHPNIAALHTALRVENQVVMILELVDGMGLDALIRQSPLDELTVLFYADQILSALEFAHQRGVIHRDIKPANILITRRGQIKLTDFGIALPAREMKLTRTGHALGSLPYSSPEQIRGEVVDGRSDVYSLGVTLYEALVGKRPIEGDNEYDLINGHMQTVPLLPCELVPGLSPALSNAVMRALEKDPLRRFQSASEFRAALSGPPKDSTAAPALSIPPVVPSSSPAPPAISPEEIAKVESKLVRVLGPIARHMVAAGARRSSNIAELCRGLAEQIPEPKEREAFLRSVQTRTTVDLPPGPGKTAAAPSSIIAWDPAWLSGLEQALAPHLGPIAKVLVKNAAKRACTADELIGMLAAEIQSDRDRNRFLSSAPR